MTIAAELKLASCTTWRTQSRDASRDSHVIKAVVLSAAPKDFARFARLKHGRSHIVVLGHLAILLSAWVIVNEHKWDILLRRRRNGLRSRLSDAGLKEAGSHRRLACGRG